MRHVPAEDGTFTRCPDCFARVQVEREITTRRYPRSWLKCEPQLVTQMFGETTEVGQVLSEILAGTASLVHAYGPPGERRHAFIGALAHGFLQQGRGVQVFDTAELALHHYGSDKTHDRWFMLYRRVEPVILQFGMETHAPTGNFYIRQLLERSVQHHHPMVLVTDQPIEYHVPRYEGLHELLSSLQVSPMNVRLAA